MWDQTCDLESFRRIFGRESREEYVKTTGSPDVAGVVVQSGLGTTTQTVK
jgi:hypothetical protein